MTNTPAHLRAIIDRRSAQGLAIEVHFPDRPVDRPFIAYAQNEAQRDAWLAKYHAMGVYAAVTDKRP